MSDLRIIGLEVSQLMILVVFDRIVGSVDCFSRILNINQLIVIVKVGLCRFMIAR